MSHLANSWIDIYKAYDVWLRIYSEYIHGVSLEMSRLVFKCPFDRFISNVNVELNSLGNQSNVLIYDVTDGADVELVVKRSRGKDDYTNHHGDAERERHGHSHDVPDSVASIAWMVIMGDGLHNFTDGLAIGMCLTINGLVESTNAPCVNMFKDEIGQYLTMFSC